MQLPPCCPPPPPAGRGSLVKLFGSNPNDLGRSLAEAAPLLHAAGAEAVPIYGFYNK